MRRREPSGWSASSPVVGVRVGFKQKAYLGVNPLFTEKNKNQKIKITCYSVFQYPNIKKEKASNFNRT